MAGRMTNVVEALNHKVVRLFGSFAPQGTSQPLPNPIWAGSASAGQWGLGIASITRSNVGIWLVTLSDSWYRVLAWNTEVKPADGAAAAVAVESGVCNINVTGAVVNSIPAKTLNITNSTVGSSPALADIAAATGALICFQLDVQNTSVQ